MKGSVTRIVLTALLCAVTLLAGRESGAQQNPERSLRIGGAGLASAQIDRCAKEYCRKHPDWDAVVTGGSTGRGFEKFSRGELDVVIASREILSGERILLESQGISVISKPVGKAGVAVITSPHNSVESLTLDQLRGIYEGKISNWKEVGGMDSDIRVLSRRVPESGAAVLFQRIILKGQPFTRRAVYPERWGTVITVCERAKDLPIGLAPASRSLDGTKIIGLKMDESSPAILPTEENVERGLYPIVATVYLYWNQKSSDTRIKPFVAYCISRMGSK